MKVVRLPAQRFGSLYHQEISLVLMLMTPSGFEPATFGLQRSASNSYATAYPQFTQQARIGLYILRQEILLGLHICIEIFIFISGIYRQYRSIMQQPIAIHAFLTFYPHKVYLNLYLKNINFLNLTCFLNNSLQLILCNSCSDFMTTHS